MELPRLPSLRRCLLVVALFALAGVLVYGRSLENGFVRWDDGLLITENPIVRGSSLASLARAFTTFDPELYIPVTFLSYKLDFVIGGIDPFVYHLDSLLLHIANALLIAWVFFLLFRRGWIAIALALLFLLHPLHTEAVAWASGRKDLLSMLFGLSSVIAYLFYVEGKRRSLLVLSLAFFTLGLASKVMILTLPVLLLLFDDLLGRAKNRALFVEKLPYVALSLVFGIVALLGKTDVIAQTTPLETILMAGRSALFYPWKFLWPLHLSVLYPYLGTIRLSDPVFFLPLLGVALLLALAVVSRLKTRAVSAGILFYLIAVAPTFVNFAKGEGDLYLASDRYAYLPSVGFLILLGAALVWIERRLSRTRVRFVAWPLLGITLAACAVLTVRQSLVWKDTETLFMHVLAQEPRSYIAHANLGNMHRRAGEDEEAIAAFEASLGVRPHARTYSNLGAVYRKRGDIAKAKEQYAKALALDPQSKEAHFGLGIVLAQTGDLEGAEKEYRAALAIDPGYGEAWTNLGVLQQRQGKMDEAALSYRTAVAHDAWLADAYYNLGVLEGKRGRNEEAIAAYRSAIEIDPSSVAVRLNLGVLLFNAGNREAAIAQFEAVLRVQPDNASARKALEQIGAR